MKRPQFTRRRIVLILIFLGIGALLHFFLLNPAWAIYQSGQAIRSDMADLQTAWEKRELEKIQAGIDGLGNQFIQIQSRLERLRWMDAVPGLQVYYQDLSRLNTAGLLTLQTAQTVLAELIPYAHVFGFPTIENPSGSSSDLQSVIRILPQLVLILDSQTDQLDQILSQMAQLHPGLYPEEIQNFRLRESIAKIVEQAQFWQSNSGDLQTIIRFLPDLMGAQTPRHYLVLFQNDKELRPTGGFITSYAILEIDAGQLRVSDARNIYEVSDAEAFLPPPGPIVTYLKQSGWRMRDTNFSPDFKTAMETFDFYWQNLGLTATDGIVALDTQFVASILEQLGPVTVNDYSYDFSDFPYLPAECQTGGESFTHTNVVCRLEVYAQRLSLNQLQRKAVIGELMTRLFEKVMTLPQDEWYPLIQRVVGQFAEKHILVYLKNEDVQRLAEKYNWAGQIQNFDGDYLHINDANLAGLKSDMYLKRSIEQKYETDESGRIVKRVKIIYENTGAFDGWLNATSRNYVRVYVPLGSELIEVQGEGVKTTQFEELGKTVFDNFLLIPPLSTNAIEFVYRLPTPETASLELLIQKQPGVEKVFHRLEKNGEIMDFELTEDERIKVF